MAKPPSEPPGPGLGPGGEKARREARLAQALRANLRKRKAGAALKPAAAEKPED